jgi:hypothetical protein
VSRNCDEPFGFSAEVKLRFGRNLLPSSETAAGLALLNLKSMKNRKRLLLLLRFREFKIAL